ncbi:hypothetical protein : Amino-acid ABC transporter permease protein Y4TF-like OS=Blastopirellula marina DSM 3645 GN=DSM3645_23001 PE=4 SV=1 [Gemmataceae bacterium]|nr:hypothetical protein : Amino-acid ABC transporter permease protein Y4TF-like OS=Blastopirellula marina DSM 3645 GN=DSM3645_23001 PE=4 SV=1 [Gemmataceae bacterium]VTU02272.1 hypothetical protein : Amino-acid ABC transporter permease protein Y4TF-like OS=Blastopirellula marina DSM 3645 GN=DSM3645_23001 PE=4 SV=1 [Gemmataceae bacterium]
MTPHPKSVLHLFAALVLAAPLAFPVAELAARPAGFAALLEAPRAAPLVLNTLGLAAGAVLVAVPLGTAAAVALERGRVPGRALLRGLVVIGLVVPLPVCAAAWQAVFRVAAVPDAGGWRPWALGLLPAAWIHGVAGLPWVAASVALALRTTDPRLEDDARLLGGRRAAWRWVLWPRVRAAALAGACWVAVAAFTESAVTDLFMVRTFAEEVYFQLVGNPAGVAAAVAVTLPAWLAAAVAGGLILRRGAALRVPADPPEPREPAGSWSLAAAVWLGALVLVGVPLAGLVARTGDAEQLARVARTHGGTLASSGVWAAAAGLIAARFALAACVWARDSRPAARLLLGSTAVAWVTPAPVIGLGLKGLIGVLVAAEDAVLGPAAGFAPVRALLYDQPSPVAPVWAAVVKFFPVAVAILWPAVRAVPHELVEAALLDGGPRAVRRDVIGPATGRAVRLAAAAVALLALGEVVATKLVQPPGWRTFAGDLFDAMHYGADATVAAMCLLHVAVAGLAAAALLAPWDSRAESAANRENH